MTQVSKVSDSHARDDSYLMTEHGYGGGVS